MPTSKLDRLNRLLEGDKRIAQADPDKPHVTESDFNPKSSTNKQAMPDKELAEVPWKIPEVAQYTRKITPPLPPLPTGRNFDLLTKSDYGEDSVAFPSRPAANKLPTNFVPDGKSRQEDYQIRALQRESPVASASNLAEHDFDGNPLTGHFCPLALVAKFPYKYMADTDDRVSRHFFAQNKFYQRKWDIYYIVPPGPMMAKSILLLPLEQVKQLIQQINLVFKTDVDCPPDPFTLSFFADGTPQPKFLGVSYSRDDLTGMEASIPTIPDSCGERVEDLPQADTENLLSSGLAAAGADTGGRLTAVMHKPTERSFTEFKAKIERIFASTKRNKQAAKQKKMNDRLLRQQEWVKQLKRAQRYLGLRPKATRLPAPNTASSWSEQQEQHGKDLQACGVLLDPLDTSKLAPYEFESDPVIVCVDVEAYERDHRKITEVGVSTLDTLDLAGIAPGEGGENWIEHIRSRHFRIRGREHLENMDFCPGNANNFQFGTSEWVNLDAAARAVDQCFEYPFSAQLKPEEMDNIERADLPVALNCIGAPKGQKKRNIIFLGHDIRNEFEFLRILGSQIFSPSRVACPIATVETNTHGTGCSEALSSIIEALDTGVLYRVLVRNTQNQSLGKMMLGLGRTAYHLHNAGNDARYTLEALIALLIKARVLEDEATFSEKMNAENRKRTGAEATAASWKNEMERRVEEKTSVVNQGVRDGREGWEKALHTMKITDDSGKQIEVEDPWLMAQESDQELPQSPDGKGDESGKWMEEADYTSTVMHRDPAAIGGQHQVMGSADALDGGKAEQGGLAKMMMEGSGGRKKGGRRAGESADRNQSAGW